MFGIDLVIPDITYLKERRANVKAFLITHAHEDHVGALPYVLPEFPGVPVYASTLARGLLGNKIKEHKLHNNPLLAARPRRRDRHRRVHGHAVPGRPLDPGRDGHRPADAGRDDRPHRRLQVRPHPGRRQAVRLRDPRQARRRRASLCLLSDSTRAENPGYTPSERTVGEAFREIMEPLEGRVIVATFASNIARIQQVLDAAGDMDRKRRGHRPLDGAELPDRDRPRLPQVRPVADRRQGQDQGPPRRASSSSRRPAPRASRWPASPGWRTATTASSRSSRATPSSSAPARSPATRSTSRARSTTSSRPARTSSTTRSSAPTSPGMPARKSSS